MLIKEAKGLEPHVYPNFIIVLGCVQEVEGPFRCNGGVKSITLDPKKKSSQAIPNLPSLVPRLPTGMPIRIVDQIAPPFYLRKPRLRFSE